MVHKEEISQLGGVDRVIELIQKIERDKDLIKKSCLIGKKK